MLEERWNPMYAATYVDRVLDLRKIEDRLIRGATASSFSGGTWCWKDHDRSPLR